MTICDVDLSTPPASCHKDLFQAGVLCKVSVANLGDQACVVFFVVIGCCCVCVFVCCFLGGQGEEGRRAHKSHLKKETFSFNLNWNQTLKCRHSIGMRNLHALVGPRGS